jgi:aspartyl-tRNA(Asn)/glutamyl-tRNA(Gln) amidotransferase subunit A
VNYLGLCALAVPDGFTTGGCRSHFKSFVTAGDEAMACASVAYEQATDWHERRPPESATAKT